MKMLLTLATLLVTALMAGLFFNWSVAIIPGMRRLPAAEFVAAMQHINRAILNPAFLVCFLGAAILLPICAYTSYSPEPGTKFWLLAAASALYIIGVLGVTIGGNVPINEALDSLSLQDADAQEVAALKERFTCIWNRLNHIRSFSSIVSFLLAAASVIHLR